MNFIQVTPLSVNVPAIRSRYNRPLAGDTDAAYRRQQPSRNENRTVAIGVSPSAESLMSSSLRSSPASSSSSLSSSSVSPPSPCLPPKQEARISPSSSTSSSASSSLTAAAAAENPTILPEFRNGPGVQSHTNDHHTPHSNSRTTRRRRSVDDAAAALADLTNYSDYTPADAGVGVHAASDDLSAHSSAHHLADKIANALCDAVTAVDHLKCASLVLETIARADDSAHSQDLRTEYAVAAKEIASAVHWAPVLARRAELMAIFGQKRFLVTRDSAKKARVVVRKTEIWLKGIVKDIGRDLIVARREVRRVSSKDSLVAL